MYRITYDITDSKGTNFKGTFTTVFKNPKQIAKKITAMHTIYLPMKSHNVKIQKA